jgi:hypothetical protein
MMMDQDPCKWSLRVRCRKEVRSIRCMAAIIELKAIIAESSEVIAEGEKIHR